MQNITTVMKIINLFNNNHREGDNEYKQHIDFSCNRPGQDVRYAIDDTKIKKLGWLPKSNFDDELVEIVKHYRENFLW